MQMLDGAFPTPTFLPLLEAEFGVCQGMVLGYNDEHKLSSAGWRWCAAVLPLNNMTHYLNRRRKNGSNGPFLIILGSTTDVIRRSGVPQAFYGVGLLANMNQQASSLLHLDQLQDRQNLKSNGQFKWPVGAPLLRVWQPPVPIPFSDLLGRAVRFNQSHGTHVVPINDREIRGLPQAISSIGLREAIMLRPQPVPPAIQRLLREVRAPEAINPTLDEAKSESQSIVEIGSSGQVDLKLAPDERGGTGASELTEALNVIQLTVDELELVARLPPEQHERAFQELEAARINGEIEVPAGLGGRCDILTSLEVVEVKRYSAWRHALGQVLSYGHFFPGRSLRIHLFEPPLLPEPDVLVICQRYGVKVTFAVPPMG